MYGTDFNIFEHTQDNVDRIFKASGDHLSPSASREVYKEFFKPEYLSDTNNNNRAKAIESYDNFKKLNYIDRNM